MFTLKNMKKTPTIFWILAPFLIIFMASMPFLIPKWTLGATITIIVVELLSVSVFLGFLNPVRFHFAWRIVGAIIFLTYLSYLVIMLIESKGNFTVGKKSEATASNALLGLIIFGLPGLSYAIFGRLIFWKKPEKILAEREKNLRENN